LISQVYDPHDPHIDTDVQFGVTRALDRRFSFATDEPHRDVPDAGGPVVLARLYLRHGAGNRDASAAAELK